LAHDSAGDNFLKINTALNGLTVASSATQASL
jgi:hypothetical protein